jgi:hypothetical protein
MNIGLQLPITSAPKPIVECQMNRHLSFHSARPAYGCKDTTSRAKEREGIMVQSATNFSLLFLRALIFSAILVGPVVAFAASYESRSPSNGGVGLVLLVALQRV